MAETKLLDRDQLAEIYLFRRASASDHSSVVIRASLLRLNHESERSRAFAAMLPGPFKDEVRALCRANGVRLKRV